MPAMAELSLPFPRGDTMGQGCLTLDSTVHANMLGKTYQVPDTVHGTNQPVILMIVQNGTGAAITVARKFAKFAAGANGVRRVIGTFPNNTEGGVCVPLDDTLTVGKSIAANDLFYVVVGGPVYVLTASAVTNLVAGNNVVSDNAGLIKNATQTEAQYAPGVLDYLASYTASTATRIIMDYRAVMTAPAAA